MQERRKRQRKESAGWPIPRGGRPGGGPMVNGDQGMGERRHREPQSHRQCKARGGEWGRKALKGERRSREAGNLEASGGWSRKEEQEWASSGARQGLDHADVVSVAETQTLKDKRCP